MNDKLRDKCRYYRRRAGYRQNELAGLLYVSPGTLSKWENGHVSWPFDALSRYCELLELGEAEKHELFALARRESKPDIISELDSIRQRASKRVIVGIGLILVIGVCVGFLAWNLWRPEPSAWQEDFDPVQNTWMQISAIWDDVPGPTALLKENDPDDYFGKVESEVITVDVDIYPILRINVKAIDTDASYTVQILDKHTDIPKILLQDITYPGEHVINIAQEMGWQGSQAFTLNIWMSGEGKSAAFDLVSIEAE
jgi:transcriptional regulator with XRE-family HTH domain